MKFEHSLLRCGWLWIGTTSVYLGVTHVCFIPSRRPVFAVKPQYQKRYFLFLLKVSFEGHTQNLQNNSCWFKIWMVFVGQILIKSGTSSVWYFFFSCLCDVLLGVTYANMLVTSQWPLKRAPHLTCLGLCGVEVWKLTGGAICAMTMGFPIIPVRRLCYVELERWSLYWTFVTFYDIYPNIKYKDYVYRKMLVQEYLKK